MAGVGILERQLMLESRTQSSVKQEIGGVIIFYAVVPWCFVDLCEGSDRRQRRQLDCVYAVCIC